MYVPEQFREIDPEEIRARGQQRPDVAGEGRLRRSGGDGGDMVATQVPARRGERNQLPAAGLEQRVNELQAELEQLKDAMAALKSGNPGDDA